MRQRIIKDPPVKSKHRVAIKKAVKYVVEKRQESKDELAEEELMDEIDRARFANYDAVTQLKEIVREHFRDSTGYNDLLSKSVITINSLKALLKNQSKEITRLLMEQRNIKQQKPIVTMTEIENAVGDTSDEYLEGVVELFEEKGFTVED